MEMNELKLEYDSFSLSAKNKKVVKKENVERTFHREFEKAGQKCPYQNMAKDGIIEYNGVVFVCDFKRNAICLGDMSDPKQVLNISLPSGGSLKVNVNNLGDISGAAGMFTPEDLNAVMRAIHQYNHCVRKLNEIEEEEGDPLDDAEIISEYKTELWYKLMHGDTEKAYRIGGQEMTEKEWDKMIEHFDDTQEQLREAVREEMEKRQEKAEQQALVEELFKER